MFDLHLYKYLCYEKFAKINRIFRLFRLNNRIVIWKNCNCDKLHDCTINEIVFRLMSEIYRDGVREIDGTTIVRNIHRLTRNIVDYSINGEYGTLND